MTTLVKNLLLIKLLLMALSLREEYKKFQFLLLFVFVVKLPVSVARNNNKKCFKHVDLH